MRCELYESDKLNFIEFNITGDNESCNKCDQQSRFMDSAFFSLFASCFEKSHPLYEHFGPTRYNARMFIPLKNELKKLLNTLEAIKDQEMFISFIGSAFLGHEFALELQRTDKNWELNWEIYKSKLIQASNDIISLVDQCIDNDRILWVIGY
jgi:hypothetical protein